MLVSPSSSFAFLALLVLGDYCQATRRPGRDRGQPSSQRQDRGKSARETFETPSSNSGSTSSSKSRPSSPVGIDAIASRALPKHTELIGDGQRQYYRTLLMGPEFANRKIRKHVPKDLRLKPLRVLEEAYDMRLRDPTLSLATSLRIADAADREMIRHLKPAQLAAIKPPDSAMKLLQSLAEKREQRQSRRETVKSLVATVQARHADIAGASNRADVAMVNVEDLIRHTKAAAAENPGIRTPLPTRDVPWQRKAQLYRLRHIEKKRYAKLLSPRVLATTRTSVPILDSSAASPSPPQAETQTPVAAAVPPPSRQVEKMPRPATDMTPPVEEAVGSKKARIWKEGEVLDLDLNRTPPRDR